MLYVIYCDLNRVDLMGIKKKVISQISVFKEIFGKVYYTCYAGQMLYLMNGEEIIEKDVAVTRKKCNQTLCYWIEKYNIVQAYIRYNLTDKNFLNFLSFLKDRHIKTVLELPTYPYDGELSNGSRKMEDMYFRNALGRYVDMIATYTEDKKIWGIPCVNLKNGIDINNIPISTKKKEKNTINFIAVSSMAPWHGYERFLKGMYQYYKNGGKYVLYLRFIGEGQEEDYYKSLTEKYHLESIVEFCGKLTGKELDQKFDMSDMSVGTLGLYKIGISDGNPIKGAEYCARGIPFICGYNDMRFSKKEEFVMTVSNDEQAIDMNAVIRFFEKITSNQNYKRIMRDYAEKHLTWKHIMKPVIDYLGTEG